MNIYECELISFSPCFEFNVHNIFIISFFFKAKEYGNYGNEI